MATLLFPRDSADKHLRAARMHMRRCANIKGSSEFAAAIKPFFLNLKEKKKATDVKVEEKEDAYDLAMYYDAELDAEIKFLFNECEKYDRKNPGALSMKKVFPQGKFSPITTMNYEKQIGAVKQLILRLKSLGENHPLFPSVAEITSKMEDSDNAIDTYKKAVSAEKIALGEEGIAKSALAARYEKNYLHARDTLGRAIAEKLFPTIRKKSPSKEIAA
jgi:tetratricopeptide (TPR) repeat protein